MKKHDVEFGIAVKINKAIHDRMCLVAKKLGTNFDVVFAEVFDHLYRWVEQTHTSYFDGLDSTSRGTTWMAIVNIESDGKLPESWYRWVVQSNVTYAEYHAFLMSPLHLHKWSWDIGQDNRTVALDWVQCAEKVEVKISVEHYQDLLIHSLMMKTTVDDLLNRILCTMYMNVERTRVEMLSADDGFEAISFVKACNADRPGRDGEFLRPLVDSAIDVDVTYKEYFCSLLYIDPDELVEGVQVSRQEFFEDPAKIVLPSKKDLQPGLRRHISKWCPHKLISEEDLRKLLDGD